MFFRYISRKPLLFRRYKNDQKIGVMSTGNIYIQWIRWILPKLLAIGSTVNNGTFSGNSIMMGSLISQKTVSMTLFTHRCTRNYLFIAESVCFHKTRTLFYLQSLVRVFSNGPGDQSSIIGRVIPKTQKMVFNAVLFNTQCCNVRIKGKVEQSRERSSALLLVL